MRAGAPTQYSKTQYPFKAGKLLIQAQNCCGQGRVFINLYGTMFTLIPLDCFIPAFWLKQDEIMGTLTVGSQLGFSLNVGIYLSLHKVSYWLCTQKKISQWRKRASRAQNGICELMPWQEKKQTPQQFWIPWASFTAAHFTSLFPSYSKEGFPKAEKWGRGGKQFNNAKKLSFNSSHWVFN